MDLLLVILVILLLCGFGGGVYTSRPGWAGPDISGLLWVLCVVVLIVFVIRLVGIV